MVYRDRGLNRINELFKEIEKVKINTGLQGDLDSEEVLKGLWTEYGTTKIPEYGWMRKSITENEDKIKIFASRVIKQMIVDRQVLDPADFGRLGLYMEGLMKRQITKTTSPENSEATKKRKRNKRGQEGKPLIDTGRMRANIRHEVIM
jgi:hypothetical protein